jgi:hypothetical protein
MLKEDEDLPAKALDSLQAYEKRLLSIASKHSGLGKIGVYSRGLTGDFDVNVFWNLPAEMHDDERLDSPPPANRPRPRPRPRDASASPHLSSPRSGNAAEDQQDANLSPPAAQPSSPGKASEASQAASTQTQTQNIVPSEHPRKRARRA